MKTTNLRRITAAALAAAFILPQTAQAAAPTVETDEAVYINLDYYGLPEATRIVKGVSLNGHDTFTDYGNYADVYNMSTADQPERAEGAVSWTLDGSAMQRFYYECIPSADTDIQLPWNFDVSYKLNGVPVEAEKCAGADGLIEMTIHATPNANASTYYKNNMTLLCATGIDMSKALSIDAPGAQVQSMGTYKIVVFMGLPGEENTFTVRIGSHNFESMGLIMFMAPATLSSLDILSDMRDIKDRIGDSGDSLYEGLNSMLQTMQSMQGGLSALSGGLSGINEVRKQLIADRGKLDPQTDAALQALEDLAGQSDSLIPELNSMKTTLTSLNATVNSMLGTLEESTTDVTDYQKLLKNIQTSLDNLNDLLDDLDDATGSEWIYLSQLQRAAEELRRDILKLKTELSRMRDRLDETQKQIDILTYLVNDSSLNDSVRMLLSEMLTNAQANLSHTEKLVKALEDALGSLDSMLGSTNSLLDELDDILDVIDDYQGLPQDIIGDGKQLTVLADRTLERIHKLLADIPALTAALNQITADATSAADKSAALLTSLGKTLSASNDLLKTATDNLRAVRSRADASAQASLDGLISVLDKAAKSNGSSKLENASDSIHSAFDDAEKDLEEDTNLLNLDAGAALQSVTSSQNPTPASLQFILRTREISPDTVDDASSDQPAEEADEGVLTRIFNVFRELFRAVYGVFASDE